MTAPAPSPNHQPPPTLNRQQAAYAAHNATRVLTKLKRAITDTPDPARAQRQVREHALALLTYTRSILAACPQPLSKEKA